MSQSSEVLIALLDDQNSEHPQGRTQNNSCPLNYTKNAFSCGQSRVSPLGEGIYPSLSEILVWPLSTRVKSSFVTSVTALFGVILEYVFTLCLEVRLKSDGM